MRKEYSTVSFKGQEIFCEIDVHKASWQVTIRHCGHQLEEFSMNPDPQKFAEHLKRNYPEAEYWSMYEAVLGKGLCPQKAISITAKKLLLSIQAIWFQNREYQVLLPKSK